MPGAGLVSLLDMSTMVKNIIMLVTCIIVAICQTAILMMFLKKLKKINVAFWGEAAAKARAELDHARSEGRKKAAKDAGEAKAK